jgi:hypothetical protein
LEGQHNIGAIRGSRFQNKGGGQAALFYWRAQDRSAPPDRNDAEGNREGRE